MAGKMKDLITEIELDEMRFTVETWWDKTSQNYITQFKTPQGYQIGDADFAYTSDAAKYNHQQMIDDAEDRYLNHQP